MFWKEGNKMKMTFPHMGNLYIPLKALFENLGLEVIIPPFNTKKTLELGVKYSPEFACLPLKINIGNFIEALEKGADTIIMAGGVGPCRFGYYGEVQKEILKDLGYSFNMIILEPPRGHLMELLSKIKMITSKKRNSFKNVVKAAKIAWEKALLLDKLDVEISKLRPIEKIKGETDKIYNKTLEQINNAKNEKELEDIKNHFLDSLNHLPVKNKKPIKIGIVGEIYTVLEPFANLNIEKQLGDLGVEASRNIYITDWIQENLLPSFLKNKSHKEMLELARPYINCFIGGHGQESVAQIVNFCNNSFDGVIHLLPFTCMPEIVAKSAIPQVNRNNYIPVMTVVLDEHSGETGFRTRLEAFIDMIHYKKEDEGFAKVFVGH